MPEGAANASIDEIARRSNDACREDGVMRRASLLHEALEAKDDARSLTKRELLEAMASRHEISFDGA